MSPATARHRTRPQQAQGQAQAHADGASGRRTVRTIGRRLDPRRWSHRTKRRLLLTGIGVLALAIAMMIAVSLDYSSRINDLWEDDTAATTATQYQAQVKTTMPWAAEVISPKNPVLADLVSAYETTVPQWRTACVSMLSDIHLPWLQGRKKAACSTATVRSHVDHLALDTYAYVIAAAQQLCAEDHTASTAKPSSKTTGKANGKTSSTGSAAPATPDTSMGAGASSVAWDPMRAYFEAPGLQPGDVMTRLDADITALSAQISIATRSMAKNQACVTKD